MIADQTEAVLVTRQQLEDAFAEWFKADSSSPWAAETPEQKAAECAGYLFQALKKS